MQMMASMTGAASVLNKKSGTMENTMVKLHCPKILNLKKIRTLTAEPTKKMAFDLIMKYYEETTKSDNNGNETVEYKLNVDDIVNFDKNVQKEYDDAILYSLKYFNGFSRLLLEYAKLNLGL